MDKIKPLFDRVIQLRREMAWILVGQALGFVGGFIGIKMLTNILGPAGYGQLSLGLTIAGIFNLLIYGPIANVVSRYYSVCRERGTLGVYFSVLKKSHKILAAVLFTLSLVAGIIGWLISGREWGVLIGISTLFGVVSGINASYVSLQSAIRDRKVVAIHQGADVWIRIGLSILFLYLFHKSGYTALLGYLVGTLFITISQNIFARKKHEISQYWDESNFNSAVFTEFYQYALPFVLWSGIAYVTIYGDRWILQALFGEKEVGIYSALYQIASSPINILFTMINQLVTPIIFERAGALTSPEQFQRSSHLLRQTVLIMTVIYAVLVVLIYLLSKVLVSLLTSHDFVAYHNVLWVIALSISIFNIGQLLATKGLYCNKPRIYLMPKTIQTLSFILCAFLLGSRYGIYGVAVGLCISSIVHMFLVIMVNSRLNAKNSLSTVI